LNATVRSRISSKLANDSGPFTKLVIADAFSRFTPGVTSTSASLRTSAGDCALSASAVSPPSDMPTIASASGATASTTVATARAFSAGQYARSSRQSE
jgi:hypothetical protein